MISMIKNLELSLYLGLLLSAVLLGILYHETYLVIEYEKYPMGT